jgi:pimeloyl-ACP methyl ester carboxylesterase
MVAVDDGQLYYEEAGAGSAVVLLHGFTLDTRMWDDQFDVLAQRHRVVRYDLRGFGKSSLPTGSYAHADDCKRVMEALGIQRANIVGLSLGGRVSLDVAVRHPAIVSRVVVLDTFVGGYVPSQAFRDASAEMAAVARAGDMAKAKALWLDHALFKPAATRPAVRERLHQMVQAYSGFHWTKANPEVPVSPPVLPRLSELRIPLMAMVGERDIEDVHAMTSILAKEVAGARKVVIPGVGHMTNMEAPQEVNAHLMKFLAG